MKKGLFFITTICILTACGPSQSEFDRLKEENTILIAQVDSLNKELVKYQYSPAKILAEAKQIAKEKNKEKLIDIRDQINKYHPQAHECKEVQKLLDKILAEEKAKIEAERQRIAREKQERLKAVNKLRKKKDDVQHITWYYNPYFTHYNNRNLVSLYMGENDQNIWLRLKMSYYGDNWIFFEKAYLSYDGNTREFPFNKYNDKESDHEGGYVWEWIDLSVNEYELDFLREMVKGKTLKVRLSGKYTETRTLSYDEKRAIKEMIMAYDVLKAEK
jgi:hypothetical protein